MSNAISISDPRLPDTIQDLQRFALVGREKLVAVRAEIRAIEKVGLAKEVLEQKKREAQDIAELVTMSEVKIGAMLRDIPKATPNNNPFHENVPKDKFVKPKSEAVKELGFTHKQTAHFQKMAAHEDVVMEAIAEARENDDIISRSAVLRKIDEATSKPHVSNNSGNNEWYTPQEYIEAARQAMGSIDCDPATSEYANKVVKAKTIYTVETDGLSNDWFGNVWLNPPYASDLVGRFIDKLAEQLPSINQAIVLVNNATETEWFYKLISISSAAVFLKGRVRYYTEFGTKNSPLQGQVVVYIGEQNERFIESFSRLGWGCYPEWIIQKKIEVNRNI